MEFGMHLCMHYYKAYVHMYNLLVYLHIHFDWIILLGHHLRVLTPAATVIRDITYDVNVAMALNQSVGLF